ncbi:hypothetical protein Hbl1158_10635 [Halobaculum sp. CBA1158]|uniref:hypothetical protein n=1 Tax=Halobaculum sp. CBA1158 TaxID=2904243 RepID=UPI001F2288AD|nr:hypothetical protein [Halobaculum sp. CBA1158]UIO98990.1 hypothetical protein Hbl1158_10635 [Halobaculum sp. CBA1158]
MSALHRLPEFLLPASLAAFAAGAVAPATALVPGVPADPALLLGVGAGVFSVVVAGATAADDLAGTIAAVPVPLAVGVSAAPSIAWLAVVIADLAPGLPASVAAVGAASGVPALVALGVAHAATHRDRIDDATEHAAFRGESRSKVRIAVAVALLGVGAVTLAGALGYLGDDGWTSAMTGIASLITAASALASAGGDDDSDGDDEGDGEGEADGGIGGDADIRVAVTDAGLRVGGRLHGWDGFVGYRLTGGELELPREARYRRSLSFDRENVENEAAVVDALGRYLPRVDDDGRVEMAATRGHGRSLRGDGSKERDRGWTHELRGYRESESESDREPERPG